MRNTNWYLTVLHTTQLLMQIVKQVVKDLSGRGVGCQGSWVPMRTVKAWDYLQDGVDSTLVGNLPDQWYYI